MSSTSNPADPSLPSGAPGISAAADRARAELHQEIERVRRGVEEMLAESSSEDPALQRELDSIREETRLYVKKRVRKTEKKLERSLRQVDDRTRALEQRINQVESDRQAAEYRLHTSTERMLDGLLHEVRAIADLLTRSGG